MNSWTTLQSALREENSIFPSSKSKITFRTSQFTCHDLKLSYRHVFTESPVLMSILITLFGWIPNSSCKIGQVLNLVSNSILIHSIQTDYTKYWQWPMWERHLKLNNLISLTSILNSRINGHFKLKVTRTMMMTVTWV